MGTAPAEPHAHGIRLARLDLATAPRIRSRTGKSPGPEVGGEGAPVGHRVGDRPKHPEGRVHDGGEVPLARPDQRLAARSRHGGRRR